MGQRACENAFSDSAVFRSGNFGAGTGAFVGSQRGRNYCMKGVIRCTAFCYADLKVGAGFEVNCLGEIYEGGRIIAATRRGRS
jgi:L-aminopeptidase/D-esterase-like protein